MQQKPKIIVIGGGLAGLTSAILLAKANFDITLIERKQYPFHRVCGEYISNEVLPFLKTVLHTKNNDHGNKQKIYSTCIGNAGIWFTFWNTGHISICDAGIS